MDGSTATAPVAERSPAYLRYGPDQPTSPVIISVPHAGRIYPPALIAKLAVNAADLRRLEDRLADRLADGLVASGHAVLIASAPRALIDLNRDERDIDADHVRDCPRDKVASPPSGKVRGGLGLFPRSLPTCGPLWRGPIAWAEAYHRIETFHRPYHDRLARMLANARSRFGQAILLDLHSMPPLLARGAWRRPSVVLGDRFGRSAHGRLSAVVVAYLESRGLVVAQNNPYSGRHVLDRHGSPDDGIHAIQCEIDRSLYLDRAMAGPGPGLKFAQNVVAGLVGVLEDEIVGPWRQAAE